MSVPEKYQASIGKHGFLAAIESFETILDIVKAVGDDLKALQPQAVLGLAKPLLANTDTVTRMNTRGTLYIKPEIKLYESMKAAISALGVAGDVGFLAEEETAKSEHDLNWAVDPLRNIRNYLAGGNEWSVSIGFSAGNVPTGGVIYYPAKGEILFTCEDGKSYRRVIEGNNSATESDIRTVSFTLTSVGDVDDKSAMVVEFASRAKCNVFPNNSDIISNVAMQAIGGRVDSAVRNRGADMPFQRTLG